jgi:hypothetical protein
LIFLLLILGSLASGSLDSFDEAFVDPSIEEQNMFKNLLNKFLKLDINRVDVSEILDTFEKPQIVTFPCDIEDANDLVVNVIETRQSGFTVPLEHEGGVIVGGTYSWQCKITTSSKGIITMDCDNTIKLNPDVINPIEEKDPRSQEIDNLVILYHELLHGQLMLDAITSSEEWRDDVCNKLPDDKVDYSYSDKQHIVINPLQSDFASQLVNQNNGVFFLEEINPSETDNGSFSKMIGNRLDNPALANSGIKVTYRGINTDKLEVTFPENDIAISGNLKDNTKDGIIWLYAFAVPVQNKEIDPNIPQWIKNNAAWWSDGTITDSEFITAIEFLIANDIMKIQGDLENSEPSDVIPLWIKNNAEWWSSGLISDDDFISGIKYLIEVGIIAYQ